MRLPKLTLRGALHRREVQLPNPLKIDPELVELLENLDEVNTQEVFNWWKADFLARFKQILEDDAGNDQQADEAYSAWSYVVISYDTLRKRMDKFVHAVSKVNQHANAGTLSHTKVSVKARNSLTEVVKQCQNVGGELKGIAPEYPSQEKECGYNRYHLGHVFVRDDFKEYERLFRSLNILRSLRQKVVNDVADKYILAQMDEFERVFERFHTTTIIGMDLEKVLWKARMLNPVASTQQTPRIPELHREQPPGKLGSRSVNSSKSKTSKVSSKSSKTKSSVDASLGSMQSDSQGTKNTPPRDRSPRTGGRKTIARRGEGGGIRSIKEEFERKARKKDGKDEKIAVRRVRSRPVEREDPPDSRPPDSRRTVDSSTTGRQGREHTKRRGSEQKELSKRRASNAKRLQKKPSSSSIGEKQKPTRQDSFGSLNSAEDSSPQEMPTNNFSKAANPLEEKTDPEEDKEKRNRSILDNVLKMALPSSNSTHTSSGNDLSEARKLLDSMSKSDDDDSAGGAAFLSTSTKLAEGNKVSFANVDSDGSDNAARRVVSRPTGARPLGFSKGDGSTEVKGLVKFEPKKPKKLRKKAWTSMLQDDDDDKSVVSIASKNKAKKKQVQAAKGKRLKKSNTLRAKTEGLRKQNPKKSSAAINDDPETDLSSKPKTVARSQGDAVKINGNSDGLEAGDQNEEVSSQNELDGASRSLPDQAVVTRSNKMALSRTQGKDRADSSAPQSPGKKAKTKPRSLSVRNRQEGPAGKRKVRPSSKAKGDYVKAVANPRKTRSVKPPRQSSKLNIQWPPPKPMETETPLSDGESPDRARQRKQDPQGKRISPKKRSVSPLAKKRYWPSLLGGAEDDEDEDDEVSLTFGQNLIPAAAPFVAKQSLNSSQSEISTRVSSLPVDPPLEENPTRRLNPPSAPFMPEPSLETSQNEESENGPSLRADQPLHTEEENDTPALIPAEAPFMATPKLETPQNEESAHAPTLPVDSPLHEEGNEEPPSAEEAGQEGLSPSPSAEEIHAQSSSWVETSTLIGGQAETTDGDNENHVSNSQGDDNEESNEVSDDANVEVGKEPPLIVAEEEILKGIEEELAEQLADADPPMTVVKDDSSFDILSAHKLQQWTRTREVTPLSSPVASPRKLLTDEKLYPLDTAENSTPKRSPVVGEASPIKDIGLTGDLPFYSSPKEATEILSVDPSEAEGPLVNTDHGVSSKADLVTTALSEHEETSQTDPTAPNKQHQTDGGEDLNQLDSVGTQTASKAEESKPDLLSAQKSEQWNRSREAAPLASPMASPRKRLTDKKLYPWDIADNKTTATPKQSRRGFQEKTRVAAQFPRELPLDSSQQDSHESARSNPNSKDEPPAPTPSMLITVDKLQSPQSRAESIDNEYAQKLPQLSPMAKGKHGTVDRNRISQQLEPLAIDPLTEPPSDEKEPAKNLRVSLTKGESVRRIQESLFSSKEPGSVDRNKIRQPAPLEPLRNDPLTEIPPEEEKTTGKDLRASLTKGESVRRIQESLFSSREHESVDRKSATPQEPLKSGLGQLAEKAPDEEESTRKSPRQRLTKVGSVRQIQESLFSPRDRRSFSQREKLSPRGKLGATKSYPWNKPEGSPQRSPRTPPQNRLLGKKSFPWAKEDEGATPAATPSQEKRAYDKTRDELKKLADSIQLPAPVEPRKPAETASTSVPFSTLVGSPSKKYYPWQKSNVPSERVAGETRREEEQPKPEEPEPIVQPTSAPEKSVSWNKPDEIPEQQPLEGKEEEDPAAREARISLFSTGSTHTHIFEDDRSGLFSMSDSNHSSTLKFKPVSTWSKPSAGDDDDELSHPLKKPKDKKVRSAVTVKKTGKPRSGRMKPQHADDSSVVKMKKSNKKKGELTFTKKADHRFQRLDKPWGKPLEEPWGRSPLDAGTVKPWGRNPLEQGSSKPRGRRPARPQEQAT